MNNAEIQKLKQEVGIKPFSRRIHLDQDGYAKCPFHNGTSDRAFHVVKKEDGRILGTCFSDCQKSWDAISFVQKFDKLSREEAIHRISTDVAEVNAEVQALRETKPQDPMTIEEWEKRGRPVTDEDVAKLAASRPQSATPAAFTLNELGFKMTVSDYLIAPYRLGETFYTVKGRNLVKKQFLQENSISQKGLFNIDAVRKGCDVFVVESELDTAVLAENGYLAVSVINSTQKEIEPAVLAKLLTARRIFLVGDQDSPGQKCMSNIESLLPPEKTYRVELPPSGDADRPKDIGEWAVKAEKNGENLGNFVKQWEKLKLQAIRSWVAKKVPLLSQVSDTPVEWIVDELLPFGGLLVLAGEYGSMKSLVALYLAEAIARGGQAFGRKGIKRSIPVLFLDRENPQAVIGERRKGIGIILESPIHYWGAWVNGDGFENGVPNLGDPRLDEFCAREKGVVIVDSLIDFLDGADENSSSEMTRVMQRIVRLARIGGGVVVLHHSTKRGSDLRGSTAIAASADLAVVVSKAEGEESTIKLRTEKTRMCGRWTMKLKFSFKDSWGYTVKEDKSESAQSHAAAQKRKADDEKQEAETRYHIALVKKLLQEFHNTHKGIGMPSTLLTKRLQSEGLTRKEAETILRAGLHREWETQDGSRNAILYHLIDCPKSRVTEASEEQNLALEFEDV